MPRTRSGVGASPELGRRHKHRAWLAPDLVCSMLWMGDRRMYMSPSRGSYSKTWPQLLQNGITVQQKCHIAVHQTSIAKNHIIIWTHYEDLQNITPPVFD